MYVFKDKEYFISFVKKYFRYMPIFDMHQNELVHHLDYPNNNQIKNIEFGASKSYFGKKEFPYCYLTSLEYPNLPHFKTLDNYDEEDCHYLDGTCDFLNDDLNGRTFDKLIFCNPFGYGFKGREYAKEFLNKAGSLLNENGEIFFIGSRANIWIKYHNVNRYFNHLKNNDELKYELELSELTELTSTHNYIVNYVYNLCDISKTTIPNEMFTIKKTIK